MVFRSGSDALVNHYHQKMSPPRTIQAADGCVEAQAALKAQYWNNSSAQGLVARVKGSINRRRRRNYLSGCSYTLTHNECRDILEDLAVVVH